MHAGHALQGLMDPTVSWSTPGVHVAAAKGARGARRRGVTVSLPARNTQVFVIPRRTRARARSVRSTPRATSR